MSNATVLNPGTIISFRFPTGDCRLAEVDALGRLWLKRLWDDDGFMVPGSAFRALVRMGHAVVRSAEESVAIELEYERARQQRAS